MKIELNLSNYATKTDLKNTTSVDTSKFTKKIDLANLKSDLDKLDINNVKNVIRNLINLKSKLDKLDVVKVVHFVVDLSKPSDVVKNDVVKKDVYNDKIKNIEDKIPGITNLATNTTLKAKINENKKEIINITNLATTATALIAKINEVKIRLLKSGY